MEHINSSEFLSENTNFQSRLDLSLLCTAVAAIKAELETVIVGQHKMIDQLIVAILSNGHVIIEGVPGVAKRDVYPC